MGVKIRRPEAPFRLPEGSADTFKEMYEKDCWKDKIKNCRELLREAYREYRNTDDNAKRYRLPSTFKKFLDEKDPFPSAVYIGITDAANYILDDTLAAEITLEGMDKGNFSLIGKEGHRPRIFENVEISTDPPPDPKELTEKMRFYWKILGVHIFERPDNFFRAVKESKPSARTEEIKEHIAAAHAAISAGLLKDLAEEVAQETGDDVADLIDAERRTEDQRRKMIKRIRERIAEEEKAVARSLYMRVLRLLTEKATPPEGTSPETLHEVKRYAAAYFFTKHPERDYQEPGTPTKKEAREVLAIYEAMLEHVSKQPKGTLILKAVMEYVEGLTPEAALVKTTADELTHYTSMLQGNATNDFIMMGGRDIDVDKLAHSGHAVKNLTVFDFDKIDEVSLTLPSKRILDLITIRLTKQLPLKENDLNILGKARRVKITVKDYMEQCGIKDAKEARRQLNEAIRSIYTVNMKFEATVVEKDKKGNLRAVKKKFNTRILDAYSEDVRQKPAVQDNAIEVYFQIDLVKYLSHQYILPYHKELLRINGNAHPHAFYLGRKLSLHYNMNQGKPNENYISVEALLEACPKLQTIDEARGGGRHYDQQIKAPFERDMDFLTDEKKILSEWYLCNPKGEKLTEAQLYGMSINEWQRMNVYFKMADDFPRRPADPDADKEETPTSKTRRSKT